MVRGDDFWFQLNRYVDSTSCKDFNLAIHQPVKTITKQDVPYRVLSHWDSQGLLECERNNEKGWRKFSLVGSLWLFLIQELRKYGLSIEVIKETKKSLFDDNGKLNLLFVFYLNFAIYAGRLTYLIIFDDGRAECFDYKQYKEAISLHLIDTHLVININSLLTKVKIPNPPDVKFSIEKTPSKLEQKVSEMIMDTKFDGAEFRKADDGTIDHIEFRTKNGRKERIVELLQQGEDLDILIKKRRGQIIYSTTTRIEKV